MISKSLIIFLISLSTTAASAQNIYYEHSLKKNPGNENKNAQITTLYPVYDGGYISDSNIVHCIPVSADSTSKKIIAFTSDIILPGSDKFSDNFLTDRYKEYNEKKFWIPNYYLKVLETGNRDLLEFYKPVLEHKSFRNDKTETVYFDDLFFNFRSGSNLHHFFIINIKKGAEGVYRLFVLPDTVFINSASSQRPSKLLEPFSDNTPTVIYMYYNANKLLAFTEESDFPVWTLVKANRTFNTILENFLKTGDLNSESKWMNYTEPAIFEDLPEIRLSEIKKHFDTERSSEPGFTTTGEIPIYSVPFASEKAVTGSLSENKKIYLLEYGSYALLDEIKAPWIKIETEDSRRGWVWAGFLKEIEEEALKPELQQEVVSGRFRRIPYLWHNLIMMVLLPVLLLIIFYITRRKKKKS